MLTGPSAMIDHAALRHNLAQVRRYAPASKVWAVIKANAYGHGMEQAATTLADADGLAVARVSEALRLRRSIADRPVLVLAGALSRDELEEAARHRLELAVHQREQLILLERADLKTPLRVWIKVDTGMHRLGLDPAAIPEVYARLSACTSVHPQIGLMTHLANADDPQDPLSDLQCELLRTLAVTDQELSIGNSGGILAFPAARTHWVRPGIMLYGSSPFATRGADSLGLDPVMTFKTRLIGIRNQRRGDRIGYGGTYSCPEDMPVGVAAAGYGDGYPRHAPSGTPVLVAGARAHLVGRVSMDSITLDLRDIPQAAPGDEVVLWGRGLPVDEVSRHAGTISYELLCGLTARVSRQQIELANGGGRG